MNPISKREIEVCSAIGDRLFTMLRLAAPPMATYHGATKLDVLMDLEFVNDVCPLDFDKLLAFDDGDFLHDMGGIYRHFDRMTKQLTDCFSPRASK